MHSDTQCSRLREQLLCYWPSGSLLMKAKIGKCRRVKNNEALLDKENTTSLDRILGSNASLTAVSVYSRTRDSSTVTFVSRAWFVTINRHTPHDFHESRTIAKILLQLTTDQHDGIINRFVHCTRFYQLLPGLALERQRFFVKSPQYQSRHCSIYSHRSIV